MESTETASSAPIGHSIRVQEVPMGFLCIDKPAGMTSAHVVNRVKRALGLGRKAKVGHLGTLDPDATGVLVCAVGRATRLIPLVAGGKKTYLGELPLGVRTQADDLSGGVLSRFDGSFPSNEIVLAATKSFIGNILQKPPTVSAVKIRGERAHVRARRGEQVEISSREVMVYDFELNFLSPDRYGYRVECGPGTYVRSLARDLGESLGTGGAIASIRRVESAPFDINMSTSLEKITAQNLISWYEVFGDIPRLGVSSDCFLKLRHGDSSKVIRELSGQRLEEGDYALLCVEKSSKPVGLLRFIRDSWKVVFVDIEVSRECV